MKLGEIDCPDFIDYNEYLEKKQKGIDYIRTCLKKGISF